MQRDHVAPGQQLAEVPPAQPERGGRGRVARGRVAVADLRPGRLEEAGHGQPDLAQPDHAHGGGVQAAHRSRGQPPAYVPVPAGADLPVREGQPAQHAAGGQQHVLRHLARVGRGHVGHHDPGPAGERGGGPVHPGAGELDQLDAGRAVSPRPVQRRADGRQHHRPGGGQIRVRDRVRPGREPDGSGPPGAARRPRGSRLPGAGTARRRSRCFLRRSRRPAARTRPATPPGLTAHPREPVPDGAHPARPARLAGHRGQVRDREEAQADQVAGPVLRVRCGSPGETTIMSPGPTGQFRDGVVNSPVPRDDHDDLRAPVVPVRACGRAPEAVLGRDRHPPHRHAVPAFGPGDQLHRGPPGQRQGAALAGPGSPRSSGSPGRSGSAARRSWLNLWRAPKHAAQPRRDLRPDFATKTLRLAVRSPLPDRRTSRSGTWSGTSVSMGWNERSRRSWSTSSPLPPVAAARRPVQVDQVGTAAQHRPRLDLPAVGEPAGLRAEPLLGHVARLHHDHGQAELPVQLLGRQGQRPRCCPRASSG